ncbi:MAG: YlcI/YnfO family protein [Parolsenella sp.]|uniref:YlcI/YnfO family protein n=1 Tax=Parolsenella sp. TaxID=2083006 RepID=UPI002A75E14A|nr:YlcI/YnfO family protein [Parolsenella sp.]MDY3291607.1 YlcI/YnfO family protein [Parolsenella sp.]
MSYSDLLKSGADMNEQRKYLAGGEQVAITIRIPANLRDAGKEEAEMESTSFSAFIRDAMIQRLVKE